MADDAGVHQIGAGATEPKLANLRAMRSAEVVAPKHKVEPLPELPLPQPGTKYYVSSGLNNLNLTDMNATAAMSAVGRPEGSPERKPGILLPPDLLSRSLICSVRIFFSC